MLKGEEIKIFVMFNIIINLNKRRTRDTYGECSTNGDMRNECKILVGESEGKRQHGKPRCKQGDNKELVCEVVNWIYEARDKTIFGLL
jgi:hypothetical protein